MATEATKLTTTSLRVPRAVFISDIVTGLVNSMVSIPGDLANGVLAGVNPVCGPYSLMIGTPIAHLFTSSVIIIAVEVFTLLTNYCRRGHYL